MGRGNRVAGELREKVKRLESEGEKPAVQSEETRDCKMEVCSEAGSRKKLDQRKEKQVIEELTDLDEAFVEGQKEKWRHELLQI